MHLPFEFWSSRSSGEGMPGRARAEAQIRRGGGGCGGAGKVARERGPGRYSYFALACDPELARQFEWIAKTKPRCASAAGVCSPARRARGSLKAAGDVRECRT